MPEGHTIHRAARLQRRALGTSPISVSSPQGRFADGAALLDGKRIDSIDATGKHLFHTWEDGSVLHIHLGLFGKFRTHRKQPYPQPSPNARLTMIGDNAVYLSGPTVCEVVTPDEADEIRLRLGPDPLDRGADPERFFAALDRRTIPIAAALLDQAAIAGIGNVYRAELLFLAGIHPDRPARDTTADERSELWDRSVELLAIGERIGRIVTVDVEEAGVDSERDLPRDERLYVYHRDGEPCRRCGTEIRRWDMRSRWVWACPACQAG